MTTALPPPLLSPGVDVRDVPIPVGLFAQMAVLQFGVSIEEAGAHANRVAAKMERDGRRRRRQARRAGASE